MIAKVAKNMFWHHCSTGLAFMQEKPTVVYIQYIRAGIVENIVLDVGIVRELVREI